MKIAFDHIAIGTEKIDNAPGYLVGELGGQADFGAPSGPFRFFQWVFPGGGRIEILEPDGPPGGFLHRFLEAQGPGIHHVTFKVGDLIAMCDRARTLGYDIVGFNAADPGWKEAFLHPKQALGIVVQLVEQMPHDDEEDQDWEPRMRLPAEPERHPTPVEIAGLRMRCADLEKAQTQWGSLLGGEVREVGADRIFRWPGSPMQVAVTPAGENASHAIEFVPRRDVAPAGPDGVHPSLGTRFQPLR